MLTFQSCQLSLKKLKHTSTHAVVLCPGLIQNTFMIRLKIMKLMALVCSVFSSKLICWNILPSILFDSRNICLKGYLTLTLKFFTVFFVWLVFPCWLWFRPQVVRKSPAVGNTAPVNLAGKAGNKKAANKDPKQGNLFSFFKKAWGSKENVVSIMILICRNLRFLIILAILVALTWMIEFEYA